MKNRLLLSTAVVLAGVGFASAQNLPGNSHEGASRQGAAQQSEQHSPQSQQRNAQGNQSSQGAQRQTGAQSGQHETTGQAPSNAREQSTGRDQNNAAQNSERNRNPAGAPNQAQGRSEPNQGAGREPNQRTGQQTPNDRTGSPGRAENQGGNRNTAQQPQQQQPGRADNQGGNRDSAQQPQPQQPGRADNQGSNRNTAQQPEQQRTGQNQGAQGGGNINLTSEQRTKIRETMLSGRDVPRVDNVNFALSVGAAVPSNVRVVEVPDTLVEIHPEWRGYSYFVVRDDVVIVDSGYHVVAMVPAGESSASVGSGGGGARGAMNLDRTQIREVQIELQRQGFNIGEPDGVLGPRTRDALMAFQKQRGFQASGEIDHDTFAALSGNEGGGARGQQSLPNGGGQGRNETTGQAPGGRNAGPSGQSGPGRNETTGQAPGGRNVGPSGAPGNNQSNSQGQSSSPGGSTSHNASEGPGGNRSSTGQPSTTGQSSGNLSGHEGNPSPAQGNQNRNQNPR